MTEEETKAVLTQFLVFVMSLRPAQVKKSNVQSALEDINSFKLNQSTAAGYASAIATIDTTSSLDGLSETEKSAASLGVSSDEWKPISFMNTGHYSTLLKNNALSGVLAQKLEAYKEVAAASQ